MGGKTGGIFSRGGGGKARGSPKLWGDNLGEEKDVGAGTSESFEQDHNHRRPKNEKTKEESRSGGAEKGRLKKKRFKLGA